MKSDSLCIGTLSHRRLSPKKHSFQYGVVYFYLNLKNLADFPSVKFLYRIEPSDYMKKHAAPQETLVETVRRLVKERTGKTSRGEIRMLTQIRYFGFCFNPVTFYYCFNEEDTQPEFILAEINNTPWNDREICVLDFAGKTQDEKFVLTKNFHVSPFMPMDLIWTLEFDLGDRLEVKMENWDRGQEQKLFDSSLELRPGPLTRKAILKTILAFPLLTIKPFLAIYYQALILTLKNVPFYSHPEQEKRL